MAYTIKGTPPGFDVGTAIDYLQTFNANWPLLKVQDSGVFTGAVTHNLGYPPFHFIARSNGSIDQNAGLNDNFGVSTTQLDRTTVVASNPRYFIFRLDLTSNFTATTIPGSTTQGTQSEDYVFKVTKPGADTSSTDMRDFALHSNTRSPLIHMVDHGAMSNTGGGLGRERTVNHNLGYVPFAFVFIQPGPNALGYDQTRYCIIPPPIGVSSVYFSVSSTSVYVTSDSIDFSTNHNVSVVVLKNPFNQQVITRSFP